MPYKPELISLPRNARGRKAGAILAVAAAALLTGCSWAKRDSVIVGSVPDDYRTNHPIVISEQQRVIDLPVGLSSYGMTKDQRHALDGFLSDYDVSAGPFVTILVPAGSANEHAARAASDDFASFIGSTGIPRGRIYVQSYQASSADASAPIRVAYPVMKASTGSCGRWPEDIVHTTTENKHYANFGCSYQNNLAAQVADPMDFLGPRKQGEIDAENRDNAIGDYKARAITEQFTGESEVDF